ncbi:MAG: leucine-rich repeat domain-containing protein, partial [Paramuribaculum sp.]|nr:leucine-rich repeat domain-containing protein [Paramuribaculum sp.]
MPMKKLLLIMLGALISFPALARDFIYTYGGQTLTYTVLDEHAKTCETKAGMKQNSSGSIITSPGNNASGKLSIPEFAVDATGNSYRVTNIGEYAFFNCKDITSVIIPNSVTSIGYRAFNNCSGLTEVSIDTSERTLEVEALGMGSSR